jgi:vacuolar protein sorting-associated protein 13A/C
MQSDTDSETITNVSLKWLQVDNQLASSLNPIFIYPTVIHENSTNSNDQAKEHSVLFASLCKSKDTTHGVDYYQWLTILLQELSIDAEEEFLSALIEFFKFTSDISSDLDLNLSTNIDFPPPPDSSFRLYFDKLLLQPIQINLSYTQSDKNSKKNLRF